MPFMSIITSSAIASRVNMAAAIASSCPAAADRVFAPPIIDRRRDRIAGARRLVGTLRAPSPRRGWL
jgi:hypothetical protein